jgi:hypothetical protein
MLDQINSNEAVELCVLVGGRVAGFVQPSIMRQCYFTMRRGN